MLKPLIISIMLLISSLATYAQAKLDMALVATLDTIDHDDQDDRAEEEDLSKKYGNKSEQVQAVWKKMRLNDSVDLVKVERIIDKYGWPGPDVAGVDGNETIFLVIQHSDIKTQEKYLPIMREAVKNKKARASSLALLEDRVALKKGKKQVYGSQVMMDEKGAYYVCDLEDPDNVDKRRAEVGLEPIAQYLQFCDLKWDVVAYKKQLPEIEKKHKEMFGQ